MTKLTKTSIILTICIMLLNTKSGMVNGRIIIGESDRNQGIKHEVFNFDGSSVVLDEYLLVSYQFSNKSGCERNEFSLTLRLGNWCRIIIYDLHKNKDYNFTGNGSVSVFMSIIVHPDKGQKMIIEAYDNTRLRLSQYWIWEYEDIEYIQAGFDSQHSENMISESELFNYLIERLIIVTIASVLHAYYIVKPLKKRAGR